jgi:hypothetical protein
MGDYDKKIAQPLSKISGRLIGDDLLPAIKAAMIMQPVFQALFGKAGERIYVEQLPSLNDTIIPMLELKWKGERWQSQHTRIYATVDGMIVLPVDLQGRTDRFRSIAAAFMRWIESDHGLFAACSGLIEVGTNADFRYDKAIQCDGRTYPIVEFTLPVVFDLTIFRAENPDIDLEGALDSELFGWVEAYDLRLRDENGGVLIDTQLLSTTGLTQDG